MIAFRIHHNDVPLCVAGAPDLAVLNAIISALGALGPETVNRRGKNGGAPDIYLSVGGLTSRRHEADEHLCWLEHTRLAVGDSITITLLESDETAAPVKRKESDPRDREEERRQYQRARQTYLRLKDKYETPATAG
jgi:hypothetical protein